MIKKYRLLIISAFILFIFNNRLLASGNGWQAETYYVSGIMINLYQAPYDSSTVVDHLYYLNKLIILNNPSSPVKYGWKHVIYPAKGYVKADSIITAREGLKVFGSFWHQNEVEKYSWDWETKTCENQFSFIREFPDYQSKITGVVNSDERILVIKRIDGNKFWTKIIYPEEGFLPTKELETGGGNYALSIGGTYGVQNIPIEKNLTNLKSPYGGFLELSRTNWNFSLRIGYSHIESNVDKYYMKTQLIYAIIRYEFIRLFSNHLSPYVFAGGCYWMSNFQNTKYPSLMSTYYPLEKDKGPGYAAGGGLIFSMYNFFVDAQYFFFNSRQAVFGEVPKTGQFTNQYKLYPGSNIVNIMFGYKFIF